MKKLLHPGVLLRAGMYSYLVLRVESRRVVLLLCLTPMQRELERPRQRQLTRFDLDRSKVLIGTRRIA